MAQPMWKPIPMPSSATAGRMASSVNRSLFQAGQLLSSGFEDMAKANTAAKRQASLPQLDFATEQITALNSSDQFTEENRKALLGQLTNQDARREANKVWDAERKATLDEEELAAQNLRNQGKYEKDLQVSDAQIRASDANADQSYAAADNQRMQTQVARHNFNNLVETERENDAIHQVLTQGLARMRKAATPEEQVAVEKWMQDNFNKMDLDANQVATIGAKWKQMTAPIASHAAQGNALVAALKTKQEDQNRALDTEKQKWQKVVDAVPTATQDEVTQEVGKYITEGKLANAEEWFNLTSESDGGVVFNKMYGNTITQMKEVLREELGKKSSPMHGKTADINAMVDSLATSGVLDGLVKKSLVTGDPTNIGGMFNNALQIARNTVPAILAKGTADANLADLAVYENQLRQDQATDQAALSTNLLQSAVKGVAPKMELPDTAGARQAAIAEQGRQAELNKARLMQSGGALLSKDPAVRDSAAKADSARLQAVLPDTGILGNIKRNLEGAKNLRKVAAASNLAKPLTEKEAREVRALQARG